MKHLSLLLSLSVSTLLHATPTSELVALFKDPPPEYRPLIIGHAKPLKHPEYLDEIFRRNAGGVVLDVSVRPKERVNGEKWIEPTYCDDPELFEALRQTIKKTKDRGHEVWIYDELGYPSGSAAGRVIASNPDFENWAISSRSFVTDSEPVSVEVIHPFVEACLAIPSEGNTLDQSRSIDLTEMAKQGSFTWTPPPGKWKVCLFERFHPDTWKRHNIPRRGANIMDRKAMARFIEITHERYAKELGNQLDDVYLFFTDEPQFGSHEHWSYRGKEVADPTVQWCDELPSAFWKKKGYSIANALPALFHNVGPKTAKFRYDFYDVQSDLVAENFYGQIQDWCHANGTLSSGHQLLEESLLFHVMFSGSAIKNWMRMDLPGVDLLKGFPYHTMGPWNHGAIDMHWYEAPLDENGEKVGMPVPEDYSNKLASSIAHLTGKQGVFTESYAVIDEPTLDQIKGVAAWQFVGGVTHMSTYTVQNKISEEDYALFADFAGRLAVLTRRGKPVADVAILVPEAAVWAAYTPPAGGRIKKYMESNPDAMRIDYRFRQTCFALNETQRDYEIFSEHLFHEAKIKDGKIEKAGMRFPVLILPEARMISSNTLAKIESFLKSGGYLAFVGNLPSESPDTGTDPEMARRTRSLLKAYDSQTFHIPSETDLNQLIAWIEGMIPSTHNWEGPSTIRLMHRSEPDQEIIMLANPSNENAKGRFSSKVTGSLSLWNPESGEVEQLSRQSTNSNTTLEIPARSARFLVYKK